MFQRGGAGVAVMISIVGGLVVLYVGYSFVSSMGAQDLDDVPAVAAGTNTAPRQVAPSPESFITFDDNFSRSGDTFFMRIYSGDGSDPKYIQVEIADIKTFRKVPVLGGPDGVKGKDAAKNNGRGPGFYIDSQHVYFFTGFSLEVVPGADPNTFQQLSPGYAKDKDNVYVINTSCDQNGECTGTLTVIPGADPGTFQTFYPTETPDPNGPGTVVVDASDNGNIYYQGIWVGPLPDPDDHSVHPDTDNPVLISP